MNKLAIIFSLILVFISINAIGQNKRTLKSPIVLFNNSMNGKNLPSISYNDQALIIKKHGFDGMEYKEPKGFVQTIDTFKNHGLKMITNYSKFDLDNKDFYLPEWKHVIPKLKGKNVIIEFTIYSDGKLGEKYSNRHFCALTNRT